MGDPKTGLTNAIREVLSSADDSLTAREIFDLLEARGVPCANVSAILRQRKLAGELIQTELRGVLAYTLNPEFSPQADRGRGRPPKHAAAVPARSAAPVAAAPLVIAPAPAPTIASDAFVLDNVEFQRRPAPEIDARLQVEQNSAEAEAVEAVPAALSAPVAPVDVYAGIEALADVRELIEHLDDAARGVVAPLRAPLGLRDRLDAISSDIEDAIGDACDARLAHELIKALTVANGATQRALRQLAA